MNRNPETITLPNGETVKVNLPPAPPRDVSAHAITRCKYLIPLRTLEEQIAKGRWPTPAVLNQDEEPLAPEKLWSGSQKEWLALLKAETAAKRTKRAAKVTAARRAQQALRKISVEEWGALKTVFSIQRQFI